MINNPVQIEGELLRIAVGLKTFRNQVPQSLAEWKAPWVPLPEIRMEQDHTGTWCYVCGIQWWNGQSHLRGRVDGLMIPITSESAGVIITVFREMMEIFSVAVAEFLAARPEQERL